MDSNIIKPKVHFKYLAICTGLIFAGASMLVFASGGLAALLGKLIISVSAISLLGIAVTCLMDQYYKTQVLLTEVFHWH